MHLPKQAAWLAEYLHELTVFPKGKHDDQVDSTTQMLDWIKQVSSGPTSNAGIWHLYKQRYEAQQAGLQTARPEPLSVMPHRAAQGPRPISPFRPRKLPSSLLTSIGQTCPERSFRHYGWSTTRYIEGIDAPAPGAPGATPQTLSSPLVVEFQLRHDPLAH